jgi:sensor histidine kinase YesM
MLTEQAFITIILFNFIAGIVIFVGIIMLLFLEEKVVSTNAEKRRVILERQLHESKFLALSSQIRPHFLYNTLNALSGLIHLQRNQQAKEVLMGLSGMLRYCTDQEKLETTLFEEITYVSRYLHIQKIRFRDRLNFEIKVDEKLNAFLVPFMLLQPIVENACEYGLNHQMDIISIKITGRLNNEFIEIIVSDHGSGLDDEWVQKFAKWKERQESEEELGVGLTNVYRRLISFYGPQAGMNILNQPETGTRVILKIPRDG